MGFYINNFTSGYITYKTTIEHINHGRKGQFGPVDLTSIYDSLTVKPPLIEEISKFKTLDFTKPFILPDEYLKKDPK